MAIKKKPKPIEVVNIRTNREYVYAENFEYIGRGTQWGNPFEIGKDGTREEVIHKFRKYGQTVGIRERAKKLRGCILGCHCKPLACHGDVLKEWAEEDDNPGGAI